MCDEAGGKGLSQTHSVSMCTGVDGAPAPEGYDWAKSSIEGNGSLALGKLSEFLVEWLLLPHTSMLLKQLTSQRKMRLDSGGVETQARAFNVGFTHSPGVMGVDTPGAASSPCSVPGNLPKSPARRYGTIDAKAGPSTSIDSATGTSSLLLVPAPSLSVDKGDSPLIRRERDLQTLPVPAAPITNKEEFQPLQEGGLLSAPHIPSPSIHSSPGSDSGSKECDYLATHKKIASKTSDFLKKTKAADDDTDSGESDISSESDIAEGLGVDIVPCFFNGNVGPAETVDSETLKAIGLAFERCPNGMGVAEFEEHIVCPLLELSKYMSGVLFRRIAPPESSVLTQEDLINYWEGRLTIGDGVSNFFYSCKDEYNDFLWPRDFDPYINELLEHHPGLDFLKGTSDFQTRYCETVVARVMYDCDSNMTGKVYLSDFRQSRFCEVSRILDTDQNVNDIREFFSYEHFYVIYCKFWELDRDHDFKLDRQDLMKYDNHSLSARAIERIFAMSADLFTSDCKDRMGYDDFIWFLINDEDKSTNRSIAFWFNIVDLDGDGCIRDHEMTYFYEEQSERLDALGQEVVPFEDILCQMNDLFEPKQEGQYRLSDLKRNRHQAGVFFNCLLSLNKFVTLEQRDPFAYKQDMLDFPDYTEWDTFCRHEYDRLAADHDSDEYDQYTCSVDEETSPDFRSRADPVLSRSQ